MLQSHCFVTCFLEAYYLELNKCSAKLYEILISSLNIMCNKYLTKQQIKTFNKNRISTATQPTH